jgi:hypothetical protein
MSAHHLIHVRCTGSGDWFVQPEDREAPISEHGCETEAERAAIEHAAGRDDTFVVVHDRYERVHFAPGARPPRR